MSFIPEAVIGLDGMTLAIFVASHAHRISHDGVTLLAELPLIPAQASSPDHAPFCRALSCVVTTLAGPGMHH